MTFGHPVHALSTVFRGKFMAVLVGAHGDGHIDRDPQGDAPAWHQRQRQLYKHDWVMYAKTPMGGPAQVLEYLSRYAMTMSNTSANTLLQSASSTAVRGQTVSLFMLAMRGGMALGGLFTGLSISLLGVRYALLFNGLLALLCQMVVAIYWARNHTDA